MPFFKRRRFVSVVGRKSAVPDGLWMKCSGCEQAVFRTEVEGNLMVCPGCGHHYKIDARKRIETIADPESFEETHAGLLTADPLEFTVEGVHYLDKIDASRKKSGLSEALVTGTARIEGTATVLGVMDFRFSGGSMGSVVGEKFTRAAEDAVARRLPLVCFAASGGARMQEGILSLMQMAKTASAVDEMNKAGVPYISVLTDPTTGGVYASFASLGDIIIAEPGAHIGFAGPRLIQGALKVELPDGFQKAEYQYNNGFVDTIVPRSELRSVLGRLLKYTAPST